MQGLCHADTITPPRPPFPYDLGSLTPTLMINRSFADRLKLFEID